MKLNEKQCEKLGEFFSNTSQILVASVVIGQLFSEKEISWTVVAIGLISAAINLVFALWWFSKTK